MSRSAMGRIVLSAALGALGIGVIVICIAMAINPAQMERTLQPAPSQEWQPFP